MNKPQNQSFNEVGEKRLGFILPHHVELISLGDGLVDGLVLEKGGGLVGVVDNTS